MPFALLDADRPPVRISLPPDLSSLSPVLRSRGWTARRLSLLLNPAMPDLEAMKMGMLLLNAIDDPGGSSGTTPMGAELRRRLFTYLKDRINAQILD